MKNPGQKFDMFEGTEDAKVETGAEKKTEGVTAKGQERYDNLGKSITAAKNKVGGWITSGKNTMGRLFKGAVVGVLSAPEAAAAASAVVAEGVNQAGEKFYDGLDYIDDKVESFKDFTSGKYAEAKKFAGKKAEQMQTLVTGGALLAGTVSGMLKNKTKEGVKTAKESIRTHWGELLKFGRNSVASAEIARQELKLSLQKEINGLKYKVYEAGKNRNEARVQKYAKKLSQLNGFSAVLAG